MPAGAYLRKLRKEHGYTIRDVVEMVDSKLDKTTICRIERDERKPSLLSAILFAELYDLDLKDIAIKACGKVKIKKRK